MIYKFQENRVRRAYMGGARIDAFKNKNCTQNGRYPEEWIASTVTAFNPDCIVENEGLSICENGSLFKDIIEQNPGEILGEEQFFQYGGNLSILVKLLDSTERLVIQCHPTAQFAREHFGSPFGKSECWYIVDCDPTACVYLGFKKGVTKETWQALFEKQDIQGMLNCLNKFKVAPNELWFVAGGIPHAIGGGSLIIELQEPSDLMVIPERVTPSGIVLNESKLHGGLGFEKMFDCFDYAGYSEEEIKAKYCREASWAENRLSDVVDETLTDCFAMHTMMLKGQTSLDLGQSYAVAIVLDGSFDMDTTSGKLHFQKGDSFFIGANSGPLAFSGFAKLVLCSPKRLIY